MSKVMLSFEAPEALKIALRKAAFQEGLSISAYIRKVLEEDTKSKLEGRNGNR